MFCNKCGDFVDTNEVYCNKCGNYVGKNVQQSNLKKNDKTMFVFLLIVVVLLIIVMFLALFLFRKTRDRYYFDPDSHEEDQIVETTNTTSKSKYSTVIVYDHTYSGVKVDTSKDAYELIVEDSVSQKNSVHKK